MHILYAVSMHVLRCAAAQGANCAFYASFNSAQQPKNICK